MPHPPGGDRIPASRAPAVRPVALGAPTGGLVPPTAVDKAVGWIVLLVIAVLITWAGGGLNDNEAYCKENPYAQTCPLEDPANSRDEKVLRDAVDELTP